MTAADFPDFQVPQAHATAIAATGVPLLPGDTVLHNVTAQNIGGGLFASYGPFAVPQLGWHLYLFASFPAAATSPFIRADLSWKDAAANTQVDIDSCHVPGAQAINSFASVAQGVTKADQVTLILTNTDGVQTASVRDVLISNSRIYPADRWRFLNNVDNGKVIPGFTLATLPSDSDVLGVLSGASVAAAASSSWLFGMAPGQRVRLAGNTSGPAPSNVTVSVTTPAPLPYGTGGILLHTALTTSDFGFEFIAPGSPMVLTVANAATSGALTLNCMMTALD